MSGGAAFGAMVTTSRQLAAGLNGTVVDDNRQPLTQKSLDVIRAKIVEFQDVMSQHGIPAGTATALRLFS
jgi:FtsZ-interacting cell division protein ZipA